MVIELGRVKSTEKYFENDSSVIFELIIELIKNNNAILIDSDSQLINYLEKTIIPYFKTYYETAIKTLMTLNLNYENMIQNQYILLKIIIELLEKISNDNLKNYQIQNLPQ